jgi:hypothetical protein
VPADHKWFTRVVVVQTIIAALERLDLAFPMVSREQQRELKAARTALELEKDRPRR